mmetsp:Transcript_12825/g.36280  ORF Transcript_12825/g.36280 Transcript_12825/m.36280 type:complete len:305 (+) Transcript_12825:108-1022(+)
MSAQGEKGTRISIQTPLILRLSSPEEVGEWCAKEIARVVNSKNEKGEKCTLGLCTGSTPIPTYKALQTIFRKGEIDFSNTTTYNLDEYVDIPPSHPESYCSFMFQKLFIDDLMYSDKNPRGFHKDRIHIPCGYAKEPKFLTEKEKAILASPSEITEDEEEQILALRAREYEDAIASEGGVDLQILGIGHNGHIGFAEPNSPFDGETMLVSLEPSTREANARFFDDDIDKVPKFALTMGVGSILSSKRIILLATGRRKREIIEKVLSLSKPNIAISASALLLHNDATVVVDAEALSEEMFDKLTE